MKHLSLALLLGMSAFMAQAAEKAASAPEAKAVPVNVAPPLNSQLQAACVNKVKPTLKGAERIRDMGANLGKVDQNITFAISANGGKTRVVSCEVQGNGTLKLVDKGTIEKSK